MHYLEVVLVVTSPNIQQPGNTKFMVMEQGGELRLPHQMIDVNDTAVGIAARLLKNATGLAARLNGVGWVDLVQAPLVDHLNRCRVPGQERFIAVPFGCMLPQDTIKEKNLDISWLSFAELHERAWHADHLDILKAVVRFI